MPETDLRQAILDMLEPDRFTAWHGTRKAIAEQYGVSNNLIGSYTATMMHEGLIERNGTAGDYAYRLTAAGLKARGK